MSNNPQWRQETTAEGKPVPSPLLVTLPFPDGLPRPVGVEFGATTPPSPGDSAVGSPVVMGLQAVVPHLLTGLASPAVLPRQSVGDMEKGAMATPEPHDAVPHLLTGGASPVVAWRQSVSGMEKGGMATPDKSGSGV